MDETAFLDDPLRVGEFTLRSRLLVGTGKYRDFEETARALELSGADCVTVAVRRVNLDPSAGPSLFDHIDRQRYTILPNTAGCFDVESAVRTAQLSRDLLDTPLVKLEVLGDERTLLPDPIGTLEATRRLVEDGFTVMVYTSDDARLGVYLAEAGAACVMPAGSPIGSGQGVLNPNAIRILMELIDVPVIVDAGVGTASDVSQAMELGAEGVLLNTGIAGARDPLRMAVAMKHACIAGRLAHLSGRIPRKLYANASSPMAGRIDGAEG
ncbi:thiazole synthase [Engelhardtia mirabilis]|uniref:Thiazole synthase n=1 Tax=Engelhardtia mirabilis TaxID=2528011 RepID=A0A518BMN1_9BACT|nr:Thiazole synthase [Planctomycetes bacterium Pla133]QDV02570.1 Thiazole synthase [Planctomycetes bacterium Pla86]